MRIISLLSIAALVFFGSCSSSEDKNEVKEHNNLYFFTNYDALQGFGQSTNIQKGDAFSGKFYSKADAARAFSAGFGMSYENISAKKLKKVDLTSKVWLSGPECEATLVFSVMRGDSAVKWDGFALKEKLKEFKKWDEMKVTIPLPQNLEPYDVFKIYLWNTNNKGEARIDDMEVQFYE